MIFWSFLAFLMTLAGSAILLVRQAWSRLHIWRILAFSSGILLGVSFLRILPEAFALSPRSAGTGILSAFLILFAIEGFTMMHACLEFAEECPVHLVGWSAFGALALHSVIDGIAIAVAFQQTSALGQVVSSAILVHKFTDGLTLTGLLLGSHYSSRKCLGIVALLGLATPLGALLLGPLLGTVSGTWMGWGFGFIAGTFFYVGASDILPRIHQRQDAYCLWAFGAGLVLGGVHW